MPTPMPEPSQPRPDRRTPEEPPRREAAPEWERELPPSQLGEDPGTLESEAD